MDYNVKFDKAPVGNGTQGERLKLVRRETTEAVTELYPRLSTFGRLMPHDKDIVIRNVMCRWHLKLLTLNLNMEATSWDISTDENSSTQYKVTGIRLPSRMMNCENTKCPKTPSIKSYLISSATRTGCRQNNENREWATICCHGNEIRNLILISSATMTGCWQKKANHEWSTICCYGGIMNCDNT